jgi:two-component system nitrogen regulation response regulator NtrX
MPPLRERSEDVPLLLNHFLKELGGKTMEFDGGAVNFLASYNWPGNIRELRNLAERIAVMYTGNHIGERELRNLLFKTPELSGGREGPRAAGTEERVFPQNIFEMKYNDAKDSFEKAYLEFQLSRNHGIISRAAEAIGVYPSNLHAKIRKFNIAPNGAGEKD